MSIHNHNHSQWKKNHFYFKINIIFNPFDQNFITQLTHLSAVRWLHNQKSDNLQYNTLVCWVAGTNDSSTKRLMFQVLFFSHNFLQNSLQKSFEFIFLFFYINQPLLPTGWLWGWDWLEKKNGAITRDFCSKNEDEKRGAL